MLKNIISILDIWMFSYEMFILKTKFYWNGFGLQLENIKSLDPLL